MTKYLIDIILIGIDNNLRLELLPKEQEMLKNWEREGILLASYLKADAAGIYLVLMANNKIDVEEKLSTLPYYPYMKIEINPLK